MRPFLIATVLATSAWAQHDPSMSMGSMDDHQMPSVFGPYGMSREGSGTSWVPEASPLHGTMLPARSWSVMAHGFVNAVYDEQRGPRGDTKSFSSSMFMLMASRTLGSGTFGVRSMLSLDPAMGAAGYPLLLQTGETANGTDHLVDRQHPHDFFMEMSASYSMPLSEESAVYVYAGLPGEPALGPPAFMHRFSGMRSPEAPITHHWLDSTHITMGVVTLGASHGAWKVEGSWFNGREPDQHRWNIETRGFDSWSARLTFNPSSNWSLQASYGDLESPEQISPEVGVKRTSVSALHQAEVAGMKWGTTLAWGRNDKSGHGERRKLDGWLLESALEVSPRHTVFGRAERVENDELFDHDDPLHDRVFAVKKLSVGYLFDFGRTGPLRWSVGALGSAFSIPAEMKPAYGNRPAGFMVFLQARL